MIGRGIVKGKQAMKINGYEVSQEVVRKMEVFLDQPQFGTNEVREFAIQNGVPKGKMIAYRFAERLLQQKRNAGEIHFNGKYWQRTLK